MKGTPPFFWIEAQSLALGFQKPALKLLPCGLYASCALSFRTWALVIGLVYPTRCQRKAAISTRAKQVVNRDAFRGDVGSSRGTVAGPRRCLRVRGRLLSPTVPVFKYSGVVVSNSLRLEWFCGTMTPLALFP